MSSITNDDLVIDVDDFVFADDEFVIDVRRFHDRCRR